VADLDPGNPGPGSELSTVTPEHRMADSYSPDTKALQALRELGFTAGNIVPEKGIIRGTSVLVALSDSNPNDAIIRPDVFEHIAFETVPRREEAGVYPQSLMGILSAVRQSFYDAQHDALERRAYERAPQGRKRPAFNPASQALGPALRQERTVAFDPKSALMVDQAARLAGEFGLNYCMVASGQEWRRPLLAKDAAATLIVPLNYPEIPKLTEEDDWNALTLDQLRAWDWAPEDAALLRQEGVEIALTTFQLEDKKNFRHNLALALDRGLSEDDALAALTTVPAKLCGVSTNLGTIEPGKIANLTVVSGKGYFDPESKVTAVWIDGRFYRTETEAPKPEIATAQEDKPAAGKPSRPGRAAAERELLKKRVAHSPLEGRGPLESPGSILLTNATIWTCGPAGRLENASMLVENGKISAVAQSILPPAGARVVDAAGKQITPGIIDPHSHSMILGDVNEGTLPSSAMVRIGDVINSESANLYFQLAGGVTEAHLLHGSANPIGGQCCLIKLRDGAPPGELKFKNAPGTIKFALGENVKQSNWGDRVTNRFPQTRMGVPVFIANRFAAARQYRKAWDDYNKAPRGATNAAVPPKRDLELEAIGEILEGARFIHCHSYRQDEILAFLRLMQSFGVRPAAMHHVLEGYKIADELAAAGVGASAFSDWWAYKFEVYDAIPYNGTLMHDRGVLVSFNSDSDDLARRLNFEAAKAVKYGGLSEMEALKFVTLNPAKQLRVDQFVGSLEPGKYADFVLWSRSPLDSATVCLETWIEGRKYFDRALEPKRTAALEAERGALLAKAKKASALPGPESGGPQVRRQFFETALEHQDDFYNHDRDAELSRQ
jgi:imidazolonepropionase-like amidohydrolase